MGVGDGHGAIFLLLPGAHLDVGHAAAEPRDGRARGGLDHPRRAQVVDRQRDRLRDRTACRSPAAASKLQCSRAARRPCRRAVRAAPDCRSGAARRAAARSGRRRARSRARRASARTESPRAAARGRAFCALGEQRAQIESLRALSHRASRPWRAAARLRLQHEGRGHRRDRVALVVVVGGAARERDVARELVALDARVERRLAAWTAAGSRCAGRAWRSAAAPPSALNTAAPPVESSSVVTTPPCSMPVDRIADQVGPARHHRRPRRRARPKRTECRAPACAGRPAPCVDAIMRLRSPMQIRSLTMTRRSLALLALRMLAARARACARSSLRLLCCAAGVGSRLRG